MIPENPTEESIKPLLATLPVPYVPVIRANVVNKNGRVYTPECLERAAADLRERIRTGHVMIKRPAQRVDEEHNLIPCVEMVGVLHDAHFDGTALNIQARLGGKLKERKDVRYTVDATGAGSGNELYEVQIHSIMVDVHHPRVSNRRKH